MHQHETPQFLDEPLPSVLGPTWPEVGSILLALVVLVVLHGLLGGLPLGSMGLLLWMTPSGLIVLGGFCLYRGRMEPYPRQILGYLTRCTRRALHGGLAGARSAAADQIARLMKRSGP